MKWNEVAVQSDFQALAELDVISQGPVTVLAEFLVKVKVKA